MNVRRYAVALAGLLLPGLLVLGMFGCGSASNNDQGVSFLFTGFFQDVVGTTGLTGISVPLTSSAGGDTEGAPFGGSVTAALGFQNNIEGQGIRMQRVYLSFFVPGAAAQPPSTSYGLGGVMGPAGTSLTNPTTLPPGYANVPNELKAEVPVLPFEIREWLAFNKSSLPEPPFALDVTAFANGITSAGDQLSTNSSILTITITPEITIPPSNGSGSGSSSSTGPATGDDGIGEQIDDGSGDGSSQ